MTITPAAPPHTPQLPKQITLSPRQNTTSASSGGPSRVKDVLASVVVFLVALPLCMGIAIASGAPPSAGLITGIIGGIVVGALQGCTLQVSGPAAGLAVLTFQIVQDQGLATLGLVVFASGILQIMAAVLRGGRVFRAVPPAVIYGMLAGIGVLILCSQFHVMVDDRPQSSGLANLLSIPSAIYKGIMPNADLPHEEAALTGIVTLCTMLAWGKFSKGRLRLVPPPLVGVTAGTLLANLLGLPIAHVNIPENFFGSLQTFTADSFNALHSAKVWTLAAAMAVVASAETLLCAAAVDKMQSGERTDYNRELAAQGVGNMICGCLGGLPMTGVIVRSSANVQAGAKTRLSAMLHGCWILVLVACLPSVLRLVPLASLAGILVFTGWKLATEAPVRQLFRFDRFQIVVYGVTMVTIVCHDLLTGVLAGLGTSVLGLVWRLSHLVIDLQEDEAKNAIHIRLVGAATFLRLPDLAELFERLPAHREIHLHLENLSFIDHAAMDMFRNWRQQMKTQGGSMEIQWGRRWSQPEVMVSP